MFYIPPSADEAKKAGRKMKHLPHFRGPAIVTKALSATTYEIKFKERTYKRSVAELRRYNASGPPTGLNVFNDEAAMSTDLRPGNFVALCESDDPADEQFHVAKVVNINADEKTATLRQYATKTSNLKLAVWQPLFVWRRRDPENANRQIHTYRIGGVESNKFKPVEDTVELDDPADEFPYIRHCNLKLLSSGKLAAASRHQLSDKNLRHHQLGRTYT